MGHREDALRRIDKMVKPVYVETRPAHRRSTADPPKVDVKMKPCNGCADRQYADRDQRCLTCDNTRLIPNMEKTLRFPIGKHGLMIGAVSNSDGKPLMFKDGVPVYAKYYLLDDFETPVLDPSLCYFLTPDECRFVAEIYSDMYERGVENIDRMFSAVYVAYFRAMSKLPHLVLELRSRKEKLTSQEYMKLIGDFTSSIMQQK